MPAKRPRRLPQVEPTRRVVLDSIANVQKTAEEARDYAERVLLEVRGSDDPASPNRGQRGQIADHEKRLVSVETGQTKLTTAVEGIQESVADIAKKLAAGTPAAQASEALSEVKQQKELNRQRFRNQMWVLAAAVVAAATAWLSKWP